MPDLQINGTRLLDRLRTLGGIGRDAAGRLTRLAGSDSDKLGRDALVDWIREGGLTVRVDHIGNVFGLWESPENAGRSAILVGSHIDTVIDAGIYDGCYGVLAGLEVIEALRKARFEPAHPIAVAAFTNEEGVRYAPDMMGSSVYAGGLTLAEALNTRGTDGTLLGEELIRIGYAGADEPGFLKAGAYVELHIEQGPVLETADVAIGAVADLQGISWMRVTFCGVANHAGTTPMSTRRDAGHGAMRAAIFTLDLARGSRSTVATVGTMHFKPAAINVIPSEAAFTIDLRDPTEGHLARLEAELTERFDRIAAEEGLSVTVDRLARTLPVSFDPSVVGYIEAAALGRGLTTLRMTSGAGHDAQMMARICPAAMIFVPSRHGISHNPREFTDDASLAIGANVLLDVVSRLAMGTGLLGS